MMKLGIIDLEDYSVADCLDVLEMMISDGWEILKVAPSEGKAYALVKIIVEEYIEIRKNP